MLAFLVGGDEEELHISVELTRSQSLDLFGLIIIIDDITVFTLGIVSKNTSSRLRALRKLLSTNV